MSLSNGIRKSMFTLCILSPMFSLIFFLRHSFFLFTSNLRMSSVNFIIFFFRGLQVISLILAGRIPLNFSNIDRPDVTHPYTLPTTNDVVQHWMQNTDVLQATWDTSICDPVREGWRAIALYILIIRLV